MYRRCCYTLTRSFIQSLHLHETNQARSIQVALLDCLHKKQPIYSHVCSFHTSATIYGKKKGKGKNTGPEAVDEDEINEVVNFPKYKESLENIIGALKHDFTEQLSLRTNTGNFDKLQVKTNDGVFPLNQLGSIIQKNPTLIVINLSQSVEYVPNVMMALQNSGMNLNPQQDGPTTIFIQIAKVSVEHREELAKNAKVLFNQSKTKLDSLYSSYVKSLSKDKDLPVSKRLGVEKALLNVKNETKDKAELMMKNKQKELLGK